MVWNASKTVVLGTGGAVIGVVGLITDNDDIKDVAKFAFEECGDSATKLTDDPLSRVAVAAGNEFLNGVPVVGHVKGVIHDICGDDEGARQAFSSANRTSGIIAVIQ